MIQNNNLIWWTGVVEDRNDPEKLGRCKVRIFGYHTEDTNLLPSDELPWALPLQSVTSAAISGIGSTPVGIVPGTWVMGWFLDGEDAQQPIIIGTLAGKPSPSVYVEEKQEQVTISTKSYLRSSDGRPVRDGQGNLIETSYQDADLRGRFDVLTKTQVDTIKNNLGSNLSGNDYTKIGASGRLGKYQFSIEHLVSQHFIARPPNSDYSLLDDNNYWLGNKDINSKEEFLNSSEVQENLALEIMYDEYTELVKLGKLKGKDEDPRFIAGLVSSAFVSDHITSDKFEKQTFDNKKIEYYWNLGVNSVVSATDTNNPEYAVPETKESTYLPSPGSSSTSGFLNIEDAKKIIGFQDPNKQYPRHDYANKSDLNKLALGDKSHTIFKSKSNKKINKIPVSRTGRTWDEPEPSYGAAYPYNQVIETEAGHVIELDSTEGAERIHVYHTTGTYIEIDVNGTMVRKVVGDNYEIIDRNDSIYVKGGKDVTVEGEARILVKNDAWIEVEGGLSVTSHNDAAVQAHGTIAVLGDKLELFGKSGVDIASAGPIRMRGTSIGIESDEGDISLRSENNIRSQSKKNTSFKSLEQNINLDKGSQSGKINLNMGLSASVSPVTPKEFSTLPEQISPESSTRLDPPQRQTQGQDAFDGDDNDDPNVANVYQQTNGLPSDAVAALPKNVSLGNTYTRSTITNNSIGNCAEFKQLRNFPLTLRLSKNYKLGDFNRGNWTLQNQGGLTKGEIVCNLQNLANNILEPLASQYGKNNVIITSGLRNVTDTFPNEKSDHLRGCAVDLQFKGKADSEYAQIAEWIQSNLPYKQLLLEYTKNKEGVTKSAWIHVSLELSSNGSIIPTSKTPVATMVNHAVTHRNRLVNLA